jgi:hypothetical protein
MDNCNSSQFGLSIQESDNPLRCERRVRPYLTQAEVTRVFVAGGLRRWDRPHQVDDGVLIISEMFNNALIHAPSPEYVVAIDWNGGWVRLEMWDSSPHHPRLLPIDFEKEHGRGLHLIAALSRTWGSHGTASGKCVWATLPCVPRHS